MNSIEPIGFEPINLDGLEPEELRSMSTALYHLSQYAGYKALAIDYRKTGKILLAIEQEQKCELHYNMLPSWAKW